MAELVRDSVFARSLTHCSPCINCQRIFIRVKSPIALCSSLSFSNSKAFGTSKGNTAYKEEVNKQIKAIKEDGTYDKLKAKYIDSKN